MTTTTAAETRPGLGTRIDVRILLIFGFYRADILEAALQGRIASTAFVVNQTFLIGTLGYILMPTMMVTLSLALNRRPNRVLSLVVAAVYAATIVASCIGETWIYYWVGSLVEVALLTVIIRTAWKWRD